MKGRYLLLATEESKKVKDAINYRVGSFRLFK